MAENEIEGEELTQFEKDLRDKLKWMSENPDKLVWYDIEEVERHLGIKD